MSQHASIPGVTHHLAALTAGDLHYVAAGTSGSPVLLVHGFPESWWAFHAVIPLLAATHRVYAVDLRGFGDSGIAPEDFDSAAAARDLHELLTHLEVGPVHLVGQDISGATVVRLAATHPGDVRSFTAIEMGLPGFGLESLGDVTHGGSWHIGALAAPGIPELLFAGRERELLGDWAFPSMTAAPDAVGAADIEEFARGFARPGGWRGAAGLYRSMLREGAEIQSLADESPLRVPVLAIGAGGGVFTEQTVRNITNTEVRAVLLEGVGHYAALEAPDAVAAALTGFFAEVDAA